MPYIDLDSGTIVAGPIVWLDPATCWAYEIEEVCDSERIHLATELGQPVAPASSERDDRIEL